MANPDRDWAFGLYEAFARGGDDEQLIYLEFPGEPWSKSRPRFTRRGRAYQPRDDREAERALRAKLEQERRAKFAGNVMLVCRFYRPNFQRIDVDNLIKHVCDSANGVLWDDDSQVTLVLGEVHLDKERPRTIILAGNHASTLSRGTDANRPCEQCGKPFKPVYGRQGKAQRFCSQACNYAARVTRLDPINCRQCDKEFTPTTKRQELCSRACSADAKRGVSRPTSKPMSNCWQCGKTLTHIRGGRCRDCWRASPNFYHEDPGEAPDALTSPGALIVIRTLTDPLDPTGAP